MSTRRRRRDYDDDDYNRRGHGHRRGHSRGMGLGAWFLIGLAAFLWARSGTPGISSGVNHTPPHSSTVCTQYFRGGC